MAAGYNSQKCSVQQDKVMLPPLFFGATLEILSFSYKLHL